MNQLTQFPLLTVIGPTAVGKTALSLNLADFFGGEIISADSRLLYRGMDIGTAKPTSSERSRVPHHLIDMVGPDETISLGQYQKLAYQAIDDCHRRGRLPILVGGTGQYVKAVLEGWGIPKVPPHPKLRTALEQLGGLELTRWLTALDPAAAQKIDRRNVRRLIRALEVTLVSGVPISRLQIKRPIPYRTLIIGLEIDRETLYQRIDERVDKMVQSGLATEVKHLYDHGYTFDLPAMSGLGYRQFAPYIKGEATLDEVAERIKFDTHRFARQQATWFRLDDEQINWFSTADDQLEAKITNKVEKWLEELGD